MYNIKKENNTLRKAGQSVGVSGKTFKKWCDQYENKR